MRWLGRRFDKSGSENHLEKELRFHIEQQIADSIAAGLSLEEARRRANLEFGGLERVKEEVRDTRWKLTSIIFCAISATPCAVFAKTGASPLSPASLSPSALARRP